MSVDISQRIRFSYGKFSKGQKKIANVILNDYLMSKRIEAGTKTADIDMLARADINGDGKINKADYDQIKKHILGD